MMLVEDAPASRTPVSATSPHFSVFPEFQGASYLKRYDLLCQRLVIATGAYGAVSEMTSLKTFIASLAGHVAAESARLA